jgi:hypothetical protein
MPQRQGGVILRYTILLHCVSILGLQERLRRSLPRKPQVFVSYVVSRAASCVFIVCANIERLLLHGIYEPCWAFKQPCSACPSLGHLWFARRIRLKSSIVCLVLLCSGKSLPRLATPVSSPTIITEENSMGETCRKLRSMVVNEIGDGLRMHRKN